jgi:regulator of protease activity HflC (stomatin/prohibitin superfamily)
MFLGTLSVGNIFLLALLGFFLVIVYKSIKVVPQSEEYVVERFGKYLKTLPAGLNILIPFLDRVAHQVSVLERQLDAYDISIITRDNVEVILEATNFFRVIDAAKSVYRINDIDRAVQTTAESIVRSAGGKLDLDELQSSRQQMGDEVLRNLQEAAEVWGIEITRSEITDVRVDERTKDAQRQQLNAEREKRAAIAIAEGERRRVELAADAQLYDADKRAQAVRIAAEAEAYAIEKKAQATAEQTRLIADAINQNGQSAIQYDVMLKQVDAIAKLASADNSKTLVLPSDVTKVLGSLETLTSAWQGKNDA